MNGAGYAIPESGWPDARLALKKACDSLVLLALEIQPPPALIPSQLPGI
jgi:hypothetical protein